MQTVGHDQCRILGIERTGRVERLTLRAPRLASPWCTGRVTVTELMPGATVIFFAPDGTELGRSGAAGTTCQFTLIQPHSFALFARQELCGVLSAPSNSVSAGTDPDLVDLTPPRPVMASRTANPVASNATLSIIRTSGSSSMTTAVRNSLGRLAVKSVVGQGATFTVALATFSAARPEPAPPGEELGPAGGPPRTRWSR